MDNLRTRHYANATHVGHGGLGDVYCAVSPTTGGRIAVKQVDIARFPKESWDSLAISCRPYINLVHPNLVRYYDVFVEKPFEQLLFEMELCDGGSLQGMIKRMRVDGEVFKESRVWEIAAQIATGLSWLHNPLNGVGVVPHCNIKPSNILVGNRGVFKLGDFGLQSVPLSRTIPNNQTGSVLYRAPELRDQSRRPSTESDIWSLGLVLWTLCTLRHPFFNLEEITEEPPIMLPGYSEALNQLIEGCLRRDPRARLSIVDVVARTRANMPPTDSKPQSAADGGTKNAFQAKIAVDTNITSEILSNATYLMSSRPRSATVAMRSRASLDESSDQFSNTPTIPREPKLAAARPMSGRVMKSVQNRLEQDFTQTPVQPPVRPMPTTAPVSAAQMDPDAFATPTVPMNLNIASRSQMPRPGYGDQSTRLQVKSMADENPPRIQTRADYTAEPLRPQNIIPLAPTSVPQRRPENIGRPVHSRTPSPSTQEPSFSEGKPGSVRRQASSDDDTPSEAMDASDRAPSAATAQLTEPDITVSPIVDSLLMERTVHPASARADSRSVKRVPKHISSMDSTTSQPARSVPQFSQPAAAIGDELSRIIPTNDANHFAIVFQRVHGPTVPREALEMYFRQSISASATAVLQVLADQLARSNIKFKSEFALESRQGLKVDYPSELMIAAQKGDANTVRVHLRDMNQIYKERTALMLAAEHGSIECIKLLLGELAIQNSMGETAISLAAKKGYVDCIALLHAEGNLTYSEFDTTMNGALVSGMTPLMASIRAGHRHCIHELHYLLKRQTSIGTTSLMYAVMGNLDSCIPYLIDECRIVDNNGESALMKAVDGSSLNAVEFLCKYEGGIQDANGCTALLRAVQRKNVTYVRSMIRVQKQCADSDIGIPANDGATLFTEAIRSGCEELIYLLNAEDMTTSKQLRSGVRATNAQQMQQTGSVIKLESNTSPSASPGPVYSPPNQTLSLADRLQSISASIGAGPNVVTKDLYKKHQQDALFALTASTIPLDDIDFRYLRSLAGRTDAEGNTALMVATINGNQDFVEKIVSTPSMHAELGHVDAEGRSALALSILYQRIACTKILVTVQTELACNLPDGTTPLMLAVQKRSYTIIPALLEVAGKQNREGNTAIIMAMDLNIPMRFLGSLPEREATLCGPNGENALFYAIRNNKHLHLGRLAEAANNRQNQRGAYAIDIAIEMNCWQCFKAMYEYEGRPPSEAREDVGVSFKSLILSILRNNSTNIIENLSLLAYQSPVSIWLPSVQASVLETASSAILAARAGNVGELYSILRKKQQTTRSTTHTVQVYNGRTALMEAASRGYTSCVKLLLGEVGFRDENGRTALMFAAQNGHFECVRLLLIESCVKTITRDTALTLAVTHDMSDCASLLVRREYWLSGTSVMLPFSLNMQFSKACVDVTSIKNIIALYKDYYKDFELEVGRCHICLDALCTVRCLPCGHDVACPSCVREILEAIRAGNTKRNRCPICRVEIESWAQIFIQRARTL